MPVLVVRAVDRTPDGDPFAHSEVIWSAARVKFSINPDEDDA
jgi:GntR family phosphonate transport system transcriptional regulator